MSDTLEIVRSVNRCQVKELETAGEKLDPGLEDSCEKFSRYVRKLEGALVHTYQISAAISLSQAHPESACTIWKGMMNFCDEAVNALRKVKDLYPHCGTPELYDLALDYRRAAEERYLDNKQDSECQTPIPAGLFPKKS